MPSAFRRTLQVHQLNRLDRQLQLMSDQALMRSAIVFAPHQDDETLGCGGTILKKRALGASVEIAFLTDGRHSHRGLIDPEELKQIRHQEAIAAANQLNVSPSALTFFDFPDGDLARYQAAAIEQTVALLKRVQPEQVFIPYYQEPKMVIDHIYTHHIVIDALNSIQFTGEILEYPIWYWAQYPWISFREPSGSPLRKLKNQLKTLNRTLRSQPNPWKDFQIRVDISAQLSQKKVALDEHRSQMTQWQGIPHWQTLPDFHEGDWIERSLQPYELFYAHRLMR